MDRVAQWLERWPGAGEVPGSSPGGSPDFFPSERVDGGSFDGTSWLWGCLSSRPAVFDTPQQFWGLVVQERVGWGVERGLAQGKKVRQHQDSNLGPHDLQQQALATKLGWRYQRCQASDQGWGPYWRQLIVELPAWSPSGAWHPSVVLGPGGAGTRWQRATTWAGDLGKSYQHQDSNLGPARGRVPL